MNHNLKAWTCLTFISLFKSAQATIEAVDGCDHSSECVATYWRTIWILILILSLLYLISVAWTCWISSKFSFKKIRISQSLFPFHEIHLLTKFTFLSKCCLCLQIVFGKNTAICAKTWFPSMIGFRAIIVASVRSTECTRNSWQGCQHHMPQLSVLTVKR